MAKNNKMKYKPTKKFISVETGFIQAATLLDIAAVNAVESRDYKHATEIAKAWMDLSVAMGEVLTAVSGDDEDDEDDELPPSKRQAAPVGFGVTAKELEEYHARTSKG